MNSFEEEMLKSKERSKKSWKTAGQIDQSIYYSVFEEFGATKFLGYSDNSAKSKLLKAIKYNDNQDILFFDQTPFYGESGCQVGDIGSIKDEQGIIHKVMDVIKPLPQIFGHIVETNTGLQTGKTYELSIDEGNRALIKRNHSATHLLQAALIEVLGDHVKQAGSLVNASKLRFDFTHTSGLSRSELDKIELIVNSQIQKSLPVTPSLMSKDEAIQLELSPFSERNMTTKLEY